MLYLLAFACLGYAIAAVIIVSTFSDRAKATGRDKKRAHQAGQIGCIASIAAFLPTQWTMLLLLDASSLLVTITASGASYIAGLGVQIWLSKRWIPKSPPTASCGGEPPD